MRKSIFLGIFLVNIHLLPAQKLVPVDFSFRSIVANSTDSLTNEMLSNVVTEVILQKEQAVWLGTGLGVSVIRDSLTIETLPRSAIWSSPGDTGLIEKDILEVEKDTLLPEGGISAMAVSGQGSLMLIAVAGSENGIPVGKGVAYSKNAATESLINWRYYFQPMDLENQTYPPFAGAYLAALPITVPQANVTYDVAFSDEFVWIASWAGGLRRAKKPPPPELGGPVDPLEFIRIPLPMDDQFELTTCVDPTAYPDSSYERTYVYKIDIYNWLLRDYYYNPRDPEDDCDTLFHFSDDGTWNNIPKVIVVNALGIILDPGIEGDTVLSYPPDPTNYDDWVLANPETWVLTCGNHNHKAFSVLAYGDTVWVGTANGINRGIFKLFEGAHCVDWEHYSYPTHGLSGNFVVGLALQMHKGKRVIWAATVNADDPTEQRGVSYTTNDGLSWNTALLGERVYNITAHDSLVFAATANGLWKTEDGINWARYNPARQAIPVPNTAIHSTDEVLANEVYSVAFDYSDTSIWIGTGDGAAHSYDLDGLNWKIFRAEYDRDEVYAYPNPFSPYTHNVIGGDGYVRFHTNEWSGTVVIDLDVYNFAMEKVFTGSFNRRDPSSGALKWNGRDMDGRLVNNGVYFVKLNYPKNQTSKPSPHWVKLIVVK